MMLQISKLGYDWVRKGRQGGALPCQREQLDAIKPRGDTVTYLPTHSTLPALTLEARRVRSVE